MPFFVVKLGRVFHERGQIRCAAQLCDLGQIRSVISPFAQYSVAVDTVIGMPDVLAAYHFFSQLVGISKFWKLPMCINGQYQKDQRGHAG